MKWIGIGGSIIAVLVSLLLLGASSASATVLCNESPCEEGYGAGTVIEASLSSGTEAAFNIGFTTAKCTESQLNDKVENPGSESEAVSGPITTLSFGGCSCTVSTLKNGSLEVSYTSGGNGTLIGKSSEVKMVCSGISCTYGTASTGTTLGKVFGGSPATLAVEALLPKVGGSFLCPSTATFSASYTVSAPNPLFVEELPRPLTVVAAPVGGGAVLNFKGGKKGEFKELELKNTSLLRAVVLTSNTVDANENNFKIIAGGTCVIGKGQELGAGEKCSVRVEFLSGLANEKGKYTLKYGPPAFPEKKTASLEIES